MTELKKAKVMLASWKTEFKKAGNKVMWHECCKVERVVKNTKTEEDKLMIVNHALDVIHKTFSKYL